MLYFVFDGFDGKLHEFPSAIKAAEFLNSFDSGVEDMEVFKGYKVEITEKPRYGLDGDE